MNKQLKILTFAILTALISTSVSAETWRESPFRAEVIGSSAFHKRFIKNGKAKAFEDSQSGYQSIKPIFISVLVAGEGRVQIKFSEAMDPTWDLNLTNTNRRSKDSEGFVLLRGEVTASRRHGPVAGTIFEKNGKPELRVAFEQYTRSKNKRLIQVTIPLNDRDLKATGLVRRSPLRLSNRLCGSSKPATSAFTSTNPVPALPASVESEGNPYTSIDFGRLLEDFQSYTLNNSHLGNADLYHLFSGKETLTENGSPTGVIGLAYVGVTCVAPNFSFGYTLDVNPALNPVITAHEIGHNFNADHDQSAGGTIMFPSLGNPVPTMFSSFSAGQISNHRDSSGSCLGNSGSLRVISISTDADVEWFEKYGSSSNAEIASIIGAVSTIYSNQLGMTFSIVEQNVFTGGDSTVPTTPTPEPTPNICPCGGNNDGDSSCSLPEMNVTARVTRRGIFDASVALAEAAPGCTISLLGSSRSANIGTGTELASFPADFLSTSINSSTNLSTFSRNRRGTRVNTFIGARLNCPAQSCVSAVKKVRSNRVRSRREDVGITRWLRSIRKRIEVTQPEA